MSVARILFHTNTQDGFYNDYGYVDPAHIPIDSLLL
jgi:hypothetical protein